MRLPSCALALSSAEPLATVAAAGIGTRVAETAPTMACLSQCCSREEALEVQAQLRAGWQAEGKSEEEIAAMLLVNNLKKRAEQLERKIKRREENAGVSVVDLEVRRRAPWPAREVGRGAQGHRAALLPSFIGVRGVRGGRGEGRRGGRDEWQCEQHGCGIEVVAALPGVGANAAVGLGCWVRRASCVPRCD